MNNGLTYIEILMSLFVMSIMLLGLDVMGIAALSEAKTNYYVSAATEQMHVMAERLSLLKHPVSNIEVESWNKENQLLLPKGRGRVYGVYPQFLLTIAWGENSSTACEKIKIGRSGCLRIIVII